LWTGAVRVRATGRRPSQTAQQLKEAFMTTYRDRDAQAIVEAVQVAQNILAQNLPDMVAA
jgi:hypothetical protein